MLLFCQRTVKSSDTWIVTWHKYGIEMSEPPGAEYIQQRQYESITEDSSCAVFLLLP